MQEFVDIIFFKKTMYSILMTLTLESVGKIRDLLRWKGNRHGRVSPKLKFIVLIRFLDGLSQGLIKYILKH